MSTEIHSQLEGASTGYHDGAVFKLVNGQVWQQARYHYHYHYEYRPCVRLYDLDGVQMLQLDGVSEAVQVIRAQIVCEGIIVSEFTGFNDDARFEFQNGQIWVPAAYKYQYHYAHRPDAMVVQGVGGLRLHVEDMNDSLAVRRA